ncbi:MAG: TIGR04255 family protein [Caldilineaceae bacterium]
MTNNNHPSYPLPTIQEVVCEIRFRLDTNWNIALYGEYFKKIEDLFPTFEPVAVPIFIEITNSTDAPSLAVPLAMRYRHINRNLLVQLSENRIAVNILPIYPGWNQVMQDIVYIWGKLCEIVTPAEITRIGLRYINGIERGTKNETLSRWLRPNDYIPSTVLKSSSGFAAQILTYLDEQNRLQVRLTDQLSGTDGLGKFLFDIDRIIEKRMGIDLDSLLGNVTHLHQDVWDVFQSAKSEDLERLLKGELI